MASDYLYEQSEVVRKKVLPQWLQSKWKVATDIIEKAGEEENIGERDYRIPYETQNGGRFGKYSNETGDMGRGTAAAGGVMTGSYLPLRLNFELPFLAIKATENTKVAQKNAFKKAVASGFEEFSKYLDKVWHSDGTALIATSTAHASVSSKAIYTMDTVHGVQRLVRGQYVQPYASDLSAVKGSPVYITKIEYSTRKVHLSDDVAAAAAGDVLCFDGATGASPVGIRGLYYWNSYATTGTTAGVDRAVEPEIWANSVSGAAGLTHELGLALYDKILLRRGDVAEDLVGFANVNVRATVFADQMALQTFDISGGNSIKDRLPKGLRDRSFVFAGVPVFVDIHQSQQRLDVTPKSAWGKAILGNKENALRFFELPGSGQRFFDIKGSSGAPATAVWFSFTADCDFYDTNPGAGGVIHSIPVGANYQ